MKKDNELIIQESMDIDNIYDDIALLIEQAKNKAVASVNVERNILNWNIGKYITENILNNEKPQYGKAVMEEVSKRLIVDYGKGYSRANLTRMMNFFKFYNDFQICATVSHKLSWSHFVELLKLKDDVKRKFYTTMCQKEEEKLSKYTENN